MGLTMIVMVKEEISSLYYLDDDNDGFCDVNQTMSSCDGIRMAMSVIQKIVMIAT